MKTSAGSYNHLWVHAVAYDQCEEFSPTLHCLGYEHVTLINSAGKCPFDFVI